MDEEKNITIPFDMFIKGVEAIQRLEAIKAMVDVGDAYCSKSIKRMLGIVSVEDDE